MRGRQCYHLCLGNEALGVWNLLWAPTQCSGTATFAESAPWPPTTYCPLGWYIRVSSGTFSVMVEMEATQLGGSSLGERPRTSVCGQPLQSGHYCLATGPVLIPVLAHLTYQEPLGPIRACRELLCPSPSLTTAQGSGQSKHGDPSDEKGRKG